ncbi:hypothetical protein K456DRAFT_331285 [Colletotrichum gloeosporioides 23]|nr:hypothetical protein K456DRAFT_331285 [Colletotrichum gloeosporioides 23]
MVYIDGLGFSQLYPLGKDTLAEDTHTVNIVFVHGLRGHPRQTWEYPAPPIASRDLVERSTTPERLKRLSPLSKIISRMRPHSSDAGARSSSPTSNAAETTTNDAVHWPADTLPLSIPRARIWVYGYNADLIGGLLQARNQNSVLQHGNDLKMKMSRSLKDDAPIIFVAHSLGGLVVKVRLHSDRAEASSGLLSRLKAVVFCGTPHRGSDTASWALIARHLAAVAGINVNRRQLDDLSVDSQVLDLIQDDFIKLLDQYPTIRIHSFQEGRNLAGLGSKASYAISHRAVLI